MRNCIFTIGLVLASQFLTGCGGGGPVANREPVYPVSGTVTYKGQPVVDADVTFLCKEKNMSSFARTDSQGKFKLTSYAAFDGAPAGKHVITVSKLASSKSTTKEVDVTDTAYDPIKLLEDAKDPPPKSSFPEKYADANSTDLSATVTPDSQTPAVNLTLQD